MSARRKTDKAGAPNQSEDAKPKDKENATGPENAGSRCVLCRELIHHPAGMRTITFGNRQFPVHADCLDRLHGLLHSAFDTPLPTPTLTRSLTLGEFLLTKRPHTDTEILACIAYYHQAQTTQPVTFTAVAIDEELRYTGFKVHDFEAALRGATDQLAYLEMFSENGAIRHRLTTKGTRLVEHLPATDDYRLRCQEQK